jgi:large subunit ribosomal protein L21e
MPSSKGYRYKSRKILSKKINQGFSDKLLKINNLKRGDRVVIYIDPSYHKGMPHRRYHGKVGIIKKFRGRSLEVETKKGNKKVLLIIPPEHLRPLPS